MEIVNKQINELKPFKKNPKKHPEKQLAMLKKSMREFGWTNPILVSGDNMIIAGHARYQAAQELGFVEVPTISIDLPYEKAVAYVLADNKLAELAEDDEELMRELLAEVVEIPDFDIESIGFDDSEVEELLNSVAGGEVKEDDFNPDSVTESICQVGDIWQLGRHRVMCGDSTVKEDVEKLMDGAKADMVFTDPPYGIGIDGQNESKCKNPKHNRKKHEFRGWDNGRPPEQLFKYIISLSVPAVIFGGNYFADWLPATRGWVYWDKGQDGLTMSDGELAWTNINKPLRAITVNRAALQGSVHPTQKPIEVVSFCLDYACDGTSVLDLFLGSGSTIIACEQLNRTCYGMELDPHYCDVIIKRWEEFTGQKAEKVN